MSKYDTVVTGGTLVAGEEGEFEGSIGIRDGKISAIVRPDETLDGDKNVDATGLYVMPGVIDAHVHLGHGGPHEDEFESEGRSATVGGVTTMLTYFRKEPYNYTELLPALIAQGNRAAVTDFGIHLVVFTDDHLDELPYYADLGVTSFKFFLGHEDPSLRKITALPHTGPHLPIDDAYIVRGFQAISRLENGLAIAHCENASINAWSATRAKEEGLEGLAAWSASRPDFSETEGIRRAVYWAELADTPIHIVHVGSARSAAEIARLRKISTVEITAETLVQYLSITDEAKVGALAKMNPPLRDEENRLGLWEAVKDRRFSCIASDHGAFMRAEKQEVWTARTGTPSSGLILPGLMTHGYHAGRLALSDIVHLTARGPAETFGLYPQKGALRLGSDADLVLLDPDLEREVTPELMESRSDYSPFEGVRLRGWPVTTMSRGVCIRENGVFRGKPGHGRFLQRPLSMAGHSDVSP